MSIYLTDRSIGIVSPSVSCDGCGTQLNFVREVSEGRIEKVGGRSDSYALLVEGRFRIAGLPATEEEGWKAAEVRGWTQENVHGKTLHFCPDCKKK